MEPDQLAGLMKYSRWASGKLLDFALTLPPGHVSKPIGNSHGGILNTFQHFYYADRTWYSRLLLPPVQQPFEDPAPGPSLSDLNRGWWSLLGDWAIAVESRDPNAVLRYNNLKGEPQARPFWQVVLHVGNQATYHRGQIAAMMRQLGHLPPSTDLHIYYSGL